MSVYIQKHRNTGDRKKYKVSYRNLHKMGGKFLTVVEFFPPGCGTVVQSNFDNISMEKKLSEISGLHNYMKSNFIGLLP